MGETGREEEQDAKSPHWVSESCSFVRYPALLFPLSSVSSRVVWRRRGAGSRPVGRVSWSRAAGSFSFSLFFPSNIPPSFSSGVVRVCSCGVAVAVPVPVGAAAHAQGLLLAQLFLSCASRRWTALKCIGGVCGGAWRRGRSVTGKFGPATLGTASTASTVLGDGGMWVLARVCGAGHMSNAHLCTCACVRVY